MEGAEAPLKGLMSALSGIRSKGVNEESKTDPPGSRMMLHWLRKEKEESLVKFILQI